MDGDCSAREATRRRRYLVGSGYRSHGIEEYICRNYLHDLAWGNRMKVVAETLRIFVRLLLSKIDHQPRARDVSRIVHLHCGAPHNNQFATFRIAARLSMFQGSNLQAEASSLPGQSILFVPIPSRHRWTPRSNAPDRTYSRQSISGFQKNTIHATATDRQLQSLGTDQLTTFGRVLLR